jgi:hypothetical protein
MDYGRNATVHPKINPYLSGGNSDIVVDDGSNVFFCYGLSTGIYGLSDLEYGGTRLFRNVDKYSQVHKV